MYSSNATKLLLIGNIRTLDEKIEYDKDKDLEHTQDRSTCHQSDSAAEVSE